MRADYRRWLERVCEEARSRGLLVSKVRVLRTSSSDPEQFRASMTTSFAAFERERDADVRLARNLGFNVVRRDVIGDACRRELGDGVFELQMWHADGGVGARALGVALHIGETIFLYLLTSARADDLHADDSDRRGNAATELISEAVRAVFRIGRTDDRAFRPHVHARELERIVRNEGHGASMKRTFVNCAVVAHLPHEIDMLDGAAAQSFSFGTLISSGAVDALVKGMNRSEIVMQAQGAFYGPLDQVLFTHTGRVDVEVEPRTGRTARLENKHRLQVVDDVDRARSVLRDLVDAVLADTRRTRTGDTMIDWDAVAAVAARHGLPSRLPYDLKRGILIRDKEPEQQIASVQSIFSDRWLHGLRHGWFPTLVPVKLEALESLELEGETELVRNKNKQGRERTFIRCQTELPVPEGGWGITDAEFGAIALRLGPRKSTKSQLTGDVLPFAGIELQASDAEREQRLTTSSRYMLQSRPRPEDARSARAWRQDASVRSDATMHKQKFHVSVASAAEKVLAELEVQSQPVLLRPEKTSSTSSTEPSVELQRAELVERYEDAEATVEEAMLDRTRVAGQRKRGLGSERDLVRADAVVARASAHADEASEALARLDSRLSIRTAPPSTPVEETVEVRSATIEFVIAALYECAGSAPNWLNQACSVLFQNWRMQVAQELGQRARVVWQCELVLNVMSADGRALRLPLSGELLSSANRSTHSAATSPEDWAWSFFYLGKTFAEIGANTGLDGSGAKNSYLYKGLLDWLEPAVPDLKMRNAIIDCPVLETRRIVYAQATGNSAALEGIDPGFSTYISAVYSARSHAQRWGWCRDTHTEARQVAAALSRRPDGAAPAHLIVSELGIDYNRLLEYARESSGTRPYFAKNFSRAAGIPDKRLIMLRPCPHRDCPARLRKSQAFCVVMVNVPETEQHGGVLCRECLRLPDPSLARARFPSAYARPWSGRFGRGSHASARQQTGSFLDPALPDPGCTEVLPTLASVLPRSDQPWVSQRDKNCRSAMMEIDFLGGGRYVFEGMGTQTREKLTAVIERLGGVVGKCLTRSAKGLIVLDDRAKHGAYSTRRIRQAEELGVPVLVAEDVFAWSDRVRPEAPGNESAECPLPGP